MFGSLYEIPEKDEEDGEENNKMGRRSSEPSAPSVFLWVFFNVQITTECHTPASSQAAPNLTVACF